MPVMAPVREFSSLPATRRVRQASLILLLVLLGACVASNPLLDVNAPEPGTTDVAQLSSYGERLLRVAQRENPSSGLSAVMVDESGILWEHSAGTLGRERVPVSARTPLHLGSITKLFTALALMQLAEQGKLELDAPLTTYIPEFTIHSRFGAGAFTLRQMLTHYSGLPSDLLDDFAVGPTEVRAHFNTTVERTAATHLKSRPDLAHSYSNLAFQLLGVVIERVSGEPYDGYVERHVFEPLRMDDTAVLVPDGNGAWPLEQATADPRDLGYALFSGLSSGAIISSAHDMGLFLQMLLAEGQGIVSRESFREMLRIQDGNALLGGGTQGLGFNWTFPNDKERRAGHTGALPGHFAFLRFDPDRKVGVVVLQSTNDRRNATDRVGRYLMDSAVETIAANGPASPPRALPAMVAASDAMELSTSAAERYAGLYFMPGVGLMEIDNDDGVLTLRLLSTSLAKVKLHATGNDTFTPAFRALGFVPLSSRMMLGADDVTVHFRFDADRRYIGLVADGVMQPVAASFPAQRASAEWLQRVGTYKAVDDSGVLEQIDILQDERSGIMHARAEVNPGQRVALALELLSGNEAAIAGLGRYAGEVAEFVSDHEFIFEGTHFIRETQPGT